MDFGWGCALYAVCADARVGSSPLVLAEENYSNRMRTAARLPLFCLALRDVRTQVCFSDLLRKKGLSAICFGSFACALNYVSLVRFITADCLLRQRAVSCSRCQFFLDASSAARRE